MHQVLCTCTDIFKNYLEKNLQECKTLQFSDTQDTDPPENTEHRNMYLMKSGKTESKSASPLTGKLLRKIFKSAALIGS